MAKPPASGGSRRPVGVVGDQPHRRRHEGRRARRRSSPGISRSPAAASTPIAFNATDLAADESTSTGKVWLYGKLQLPHGMETVNHIWQVGSTVTGGLHVYHVIVIAIRLPISGDQCNRTFLNYLLMVIGY
ncbi:hypothetical protein OsJ_35993 [Oryza sativa Japonica Group]|uniref:AIR12 DOMON domain-containing protein n=1 Tax=Oryza sativa subsp. japonica TaxID=39947 RepID=A3CH19_ORYSJ|nr:hypothetical protein OsJ_35993 [Oryza sativa Japonica Group]